MLASLLYPYDEDAGTLIDGWLKELEDKEHIRRYAVDGHTYLEVLNWLNHQKIDRPSASKLPKFDESSRVLAKVSVGREGIKEGDQGKGGEEELQSAPLQERPVNPDSGCELGLANWLLEELNVVADNGTRRVVADSIRLLAKEGGTAETAAQYILQAGRAAIAGGEVINRFWFSDQRYRPQTPRKTARQTERDAKRKAFMEAE
jgi:hypothetical protein